MRKLYEEEYCCNLVDQSERLLAAMKRITQGTNVKKRTKLTRVVDLLAEMSLLPLTLTAECRPLRSALSNVTDWLQKYSTSLVALGIPCDESQTDLQAAAERLKQQLEQTDDSDNNEEGDGEEHIAAATAIVVGREILLDDAKDSAATNTELTEPTVTLPELKKLLDEADTISVDFPELKSARLRLVKAQSWLLQASEKLAIVTSGNINSANVTVPIGGNKPKGYHSSSRCSEAHLQTMLKEVASLRVAFPEEVEGLTLLAAEIHDYDDTLEVSLRKMAERLLPLSHGYFELVETLGLDGLGSDCFRDISKPCGIRKGVAKVHTKLTGKEELVLWSQLEECSRLLIVISKHSEDTGILSKHSADVSMCTAAMQWVAHVRRLVMGLGQVSDTAASSDEKLLWGDVPKATLKSLQRDCEWYLNLHGKSVLSATVPTTQTYEHPALTAFDPKLLTDSSDEAYNQREKLLLILFPYDAILGSDETAKDVNLNAKGVDFEMPATSNKIDKGEDSANVYCASDYIESDDEADSVAEASSISAKAALRQSRGNRKVSAAADDSPSPRLSAPRSTANAKGSKARSSSKKAALKPSKEQASPDIVEEHNGRDDEHNGDDDDDDDGDTANISTTKQSRKKRKADVGSDDQLSVVTSRKKTKSEDINDDDTNNATARKRQRNDETEGSSAPVTAKSKSKRNTKDTVVAAAATSKSRKSADKQPLAVEVKDIESSEDEDDEQQNEQCKVVVTNHISAQRRTYTAAVNTPSTAHDEALLLLRHSVVQLVNFWYRMLLLLKARINESLKWGLKIHHWQQSAADLGSSLFTISASAGSKDKQSSADSVLSKLAEMTVLYSEAEALLKHANMRGIQSSVR